MADKTSQVCTVAKDDAGKISNYVEVRGEHLGVYVPTINTAIVYIRCANDKGGSSGRLQKEDGSGDFSLASGAGGKFFVIPGRYPFRWLAIEVSETQTTAAVDFLIIGKS